MQTDQRNPFANAGGGDHEMYIRPVADDDDSRERLMAAFASVSVIDGWYADDSRPPWEQRPLTPSSMAVRDADGTMGWKHGVGVAPASTSFQCSLNVADFMDPPHVWLLVRESQGTAGEVADYETAFDAEMVRVHLWFATVAAEVYDVEPFRWAWMDFEGMGDSGLSLEVSGKTRQPCVIPNRAGRGVTFHPEGHRWSIADQRRWRNHASLPENEGVALEILFRENPSDADHVTSALLADERLTGWYKDYIFDDTSPKTEIRLPSKLRWSPHTAFYGQKTGLFAAVRGVTAWDLQETVEDRARATPSSDVEFSEPCAQAWAAAALPPVGTCSCRLDVIRFDQDVVVRLIVPAAEILTALKPDDPNEGWGVYFDHDSLFDEVNAVEEWLRLIARDVAQDVDFDICRIGPVSDDFGSDDLSHGVPSGERRHGYLVRGDQMLVDIPSTRRRGPVAPAAGTGDGWMNGFTASRAVRDDIE